MWSWGLQGSRIQVQKSQVENEQNSDSSSIVLDPLPYLVVSNATRRYFIFCVSTITNNFHGSLLTESLRKDLAKPYDPHKAVWTPDGNGGFTEGIMQVRILPNLLTEFPTIVITFTFRATMVIRLLFSWDMKTNISNLNRSLTTRLSFPLSLNHFVRLCRLILQNSRSVRTWPTWPSLVRQLSFGIWSHVIRSIASSYDCNSNSSRRPSWSTPTLASFVWWSIPINAFQSTPTGLKRCTRWLGVCCKGWIFVQGKRREETPPHLWAVTETAYRNMLKDRLVLSGKKMFAMPLR